MNRFSKAGLSVALATMTLSAAAPARPAAAEPHVDPASLLVVDCLLPGQIRKLGGIMRYLSPRRPARITTRDCEIRGGEYVAFDRADYDTALKVWLSSAEEGEPAAQTYVGEIYEKGLGRAPDYPAAANWYARAAAQRFAQAQLRLAYLYEKGLGVSADPLQALNLYRQAAGITDDDLTFQSEVVAVRSAAQARIDELTSQLESRTEQLELLQARAARAERQLSQKRTELDAVSGEVTALRTQLEEEQLASGSSGARRLAELATLERHLTEREGELTRKMLEVASLESAAAARQQQLAVTAQEMAVRDGTLQSQLTQYKSQSRSIADQLNALQGKLFASEQRVAELTASLAQERSRLAVDREQLANETRAASSAQQQMVGTLRAQLGERESRIREQQAAIAAMQGQNARLTAESIHLQRSLVAALQVQPGSRRLAMRGAPSGQPTSPRVKMTLPPDLPVGNYHALVIGNNRYAHLPALDSAINDARGVADVLQGRYGFRVRTLIDATRADILSAINDYRLHLHDSDNLLIYYAGHGELDQQNLRGYWLPVNARRDDPTEWISDQMITDQIGLMAARHVLVVADSCYSGAMTRSAGLRLAAKGGDALQMKRLAKLLKLPSRTVLTSGGEQPVLDGGGGSHSIFARAFIDVLQRNDTVLEATDLHDAVFDPVRLSAQRFNVEQSPRYSVLADAGHLNGEFLFVPTT